MATRAKAQKQEEARQSTSQAPTPPTSSPLSVNGGDSSKLTRLSRLDEKNTLIGLNNRLAAIIERNHQLELENAQLTCQVESAEETLKVTTKTINESIGKDNADIRKQLLDSENEKAKAILIGEKTKKLLDEANHKIQQNGAELAEVKKQVNKFRDEAAHTKAELEKQRLENSQLQTQTKAQDAEVKKLGDEHSKTKKALEQYSLQNAELQNQLKSKNAELSQKVESHQKEVTALRSFNQKKIEEIGEKLSKDYEMNLQKVIKSLRAECDKQISSNKGEQENLFKIKEGDFLKQNEKITQTLRTKSHELLQAEKVAQSSRNRLTALEKEKEFLSGQLKALEQSMKEEAEASKAEAKELEQQLKQVQEEKTQVINDYQDLMETKVVLDNEIATYRKLLEGEEERLNLSMEARRSSRKRQWNSK